MISHLRNHGVNKPREDQVNILRNDQKLYKYKNHQLNKPRKISDSSAVTEATQQGIRVGMSVAVRHSTKTYLGRITEIDHEGEFCAA